MLLRKKLALMICPELKEQGAIITDKSVRFDQLSHKNALMNLAEVYGRHMNHSRTTVSLRAAKQGRLFDKLDMGGNITIHRAESIIQWFSDNWPDAELAWPKGIERPTPKKKEAA